MRNQEKKSRGQENLRDYSHPKQGPKENTEEFKKQAGSRVTEANESRESKSSQIDDEDILDDEDDVY